MTIIVCWNTIIVIYLGISIVSSTLQDPDRFENQYHQHNLETNYLHLSSTIIMTYNLIIPHKTRIELPLILIHQL